MLFERELLKRLAKYESDGLIDAESARKLAQRAREDFESGFSGFRNAMYFAGALLVVFSTGLFAQNVWDGLSSDVRLMLAFLPLCLSLIFGLSVLFGKWGVFFREAAAASNIAACFFMIFIIGNTLNIPPDMRSFWFAMTLMTVPSVFLLRSSVAAVCSLVFAMYLLCEYGTAPSVASDAAAAITAFICSMFFLAKNYGGFFKVVGAYIFCALSPFFFVVLIEQQLNSADGGDLGDLLTILASAGWGLSLLLVSGLPRFNGFGFVRQPFFFAGAITMIVVAGLINSSWSFDNLYRESVFSQIGAMFTDSPLNAASAFAITAVVCAVWVYLFIKAVRNGDRKLYIIAGSLMFPLLFFYTFTWGDRFFMFMAASNLLLFLCGILLALRGLKGRDFSMLNTGILILISQGFMRVFVSETHILFRASFFAAAGIALIAANYAVNRRRRNGVS